MTSTRHSLSISISLEIYSNLKYLVLLHIPSNFTLSHKLSIFFLCNFTLSSDTIRNHWHKSSSTLPCFADAGFYWLPVSLVLTGVALPEILWKSVSCWQMISCMNMWEFNPLLGFGSWPAVCCCSRDNVYGGGCSCSFVSLTNSALLSLYGGGGILSKSCCFSVEATDSVETSFSGSMLSS